MSLKKFEILNAFARDCHYKDFRELKDEWLQIGEDEGRKAEIQPRLANIERVAELVVEMKRKSNTG